MGVLWVVENMLYSSRFSGALTYSRTQFNHNGAHWGTSQCVRSHRPEPCGMSGGQVAFHTLCVRCASIPMGDMDMDDVMLMRKNPLQFSHAYSKRGIPALDSLFIALCIYVWICVYICSSIYMSVQKYHHINIPKQSPERLVTIFTGVASLLIVGRFKWFSLQSGFRRECNASEIVLLVNRKTSLNVPSSPFVKGSAMSVWKEVVHAFVNRKQSEYTCHPKYKQQFNKWLHLLLDCNIAEIIASVF